MQFSSLLTTLALLSTTGWARYMLEDDYFSGNFFGHFSFFTGSDPTHGNVAYLDQEAAAGAGLISASASNARMSVDTTNVTPNGRPSVRLSSNKSYNSDTLVVVDLEHMPFGCGTWPAFWMVGPNWPNSGEIDIIEGVHEQTSNDMTLHTGPDCTVDSNALFSGSMTDTDCESSGSNNNGCQITTNNTQTYGTGFNDGKGGVYAMQWTSSAISIFFFARSSIPWDISSGYPNPSNWGEPLAMFQGDCNITSHFQDMQIVFDITFCGDWTGNVWSGSSCASKAGSCSDYVANNPSAFTDAYWSVNGLKVYSGKAGPWSSGSGGPWNTVLAENGTVGESASSAAAATGPATTGVSTTPTAAPSSPAPTDSPWAPHWGDNGIVQ